jgi:hypothetical protein
MPHLLLRQVDFGPARLHTENQDWFELSGKFLKMLKEL